jgi:hypothetical protein
MTTNFQINDKATIAGKTYRVYNIMSESNLVCFGRISETTGKDLSAMNPQNILTLTFAQVEKFEKLGTIVK